MTKEKRGFFYYLNPIRWIRALCSYLLTSLLVLNRCFVFILMSLIVILAVWFSYDRYAFFTYDESSKSEFLTGFFSSHEVYHSPLARGSKDLAKDLQEYYKGEKQTIKKEEVEQVRVEENQPTGEYDNFMDTSISAEVRRRLSK